MAECCSVLSANFKVILFVIDFDKKDRCDIIFLEQSLKRRLLFMCNNFVFEFSKKCLMLLSKYPEKAHIPLEKKNSTRKGGRCL